jgi:small subunit ribosomal protein S16
MALKIRLRQQGRKNRTTYRLVLCDVRSPRDGKYIETLGWYNPLESAMERCVQLNRERISHWLSNGAILTESAEKLVKKMASETYEQYRTKLSAARAKACQKRRAGRKKEREAA